MKLVAVSLAAAALLAAGAAAAAPPKIPLIRETFTPLPCPGKPKTTLALTACAQKRILSADEAINGQVKVIWTLLKTTTPRTHFALAERAWFAFRRATCLSRADVHAGGTLAKLDFAECAADVNRAHLRDLKLFAAALHKR